MDKQYNHQISQQEAHDKWQREKTYSLANNPGPLYSIDTPPPTVSGSLHIGHVFSYTQTDILARYARMSGNSVFYPFGFDDNGLPTERYVEKKRDVRAHQMSRSEFIQLCLKETYGVEQEFQQLWQRMGLSADWESCYSTISASSRKISQESFLRLLEKKYVYRKNEPALYCTTCRTSVAQAELDDAEKPSVFYNIQFDVVDNPKIPSLVIGTTRPEMLGACVSIFYHPDDTRYQSLANQWARTPLFENKVPILPDEKVNPEKGTGLVMCCTFGDKTDVEWYKKYTSLLSQPLQIIGLDGKMNVATDPMGINGLSIVQARAKSVEALEAAGVILEKKPINHSVNVHERCKKEIEILMLPQWFLNVIDHKKKFIELADRINWYPAHMKSRYNNWVENISWDWCLSRQRFYGIPFPLWHCQDCHTIITPSFDQLPIDPQETPHKGGCPQCKGTHIKPDTDVMDTWNTSSLTPYICFNILNPDEKSVFTGSKIKEFLPMSMRPQAHDIIRTWAFYTIVKAWMHNDDIPWENIIISGHVLSDAKEKLSKSKENSSTSPQGLLERYPADVIRYWTASGGLGHDIAFSEGQLKIGQRLITKIWNAFRFIHEHVSSTPQEQPTTPLGITNEWLLDSATKTFTRYNAYLQENEFGLALDVVEKLFWHNFCDNYLELVKDQLFNPDNYTEFELKATRWTLYHTGLRILQMYAPYLPYITENLYGTIYQKSIGVSSVHQTRYAQVQQDYTFEESSKIMNHIIELIAHVRKLKTEKQLSLKVPLATLTVTAADEHLLHKVQAYTQLIRGITHAQEIKFIARQEAVPAVIQQDGQAWSATVSIG